MTMTDGLSIRRKNIDGDDPAQMLAAVNHALKAKTATTRDDRLRRIYWDAFRDGFERALADLGAAVIAGRVFGKLEDDA